MNESLLPKARVYAAQRQLEVGEPLGSGKDGIVCVGKLKAAPGTVAIKVHRFEELYRRERDAYLRLTELDVRSVLGFNVPKLLSSEDDLCVLEMTIVRRPFVLDFAAAYLDARPEFPEEVWAEWEADKQEQFEARWPKVRAILDAFEAFGVYLTDVSPANIGFEF